VIRQYF